MGSTLFLRTYTTKSSLGILFFREGKNGSILMSFVGVSVQWMGVKMRNTLVFFTVALYTAILCYESLK